MATGVVEPEVEAYFARVPDEQRAALLALRQSIRTIVPEAVEVMSYGIPTFKLHGSLVAIGSAKKHCSLYLMSSHLFEHCGAELAGYDTSKGTIRFVPGNPLPDALVERIVRFRIQENLEIVAARAAKKKEKNLAGKS